MCFFDSPVARCEVMRELVLLDETQQECAHEHGCDRHQECPLAGCFAKKSGVYDPASLPPKRRRRSAHPAGAMQKADCNELVL